MARGWESKDVESQVEAKTIVSEPQSRGPKTADQIRQEQERRDLQLSRTRIYNDLQTATNPNHRKALQAALEHLDQKIAAVR